MAPRTFTNPAPKTESAREARKSFFCELCNKGYSRMNEFESHEASYDHLHKKRLKEMKQMQRDPLSRAKALRAERRADEKSGVQVITIKPVAGAGGGGGFKKGGFKNAFGSDLECRSEKEDGGGSGGGAEGKELDGGRERVNPYESDEGEEEEGGERYDPRRPTGCWGGCAGRE